MDYKFFSIRLISCLFFLTACSSAYQSPVAEIDEPRFLDSDRIHRVNEGETLYAIAWIYDLDFIHIVRVNDLSSPYTMIPGQILNVDPRAIPAQQDRISSGSITASPQADSSTGQASRQSAPTASRNPVQVSSATIRQRPVSWTWPAAGSIVGHFSETGVENKGIDIAGGVGDEVLAAADGEVVYAGSGLLRYGDLVIIKHNDLFLSAYAHNSAMVVFEGEQVRKGQKIAELGSTGVDREMLHFEIRLEGNPVDPVNYLPPRS